MHIPPTVNYFAVLVSGIAIFILGGLWFSPVLFGKKWIALQKKTPEEMKAEAAAMNMPMAYLQVFLCGLITAYTMAIVLNHFTPLSIAKGSLVAVVCWVGFTAVTSYGTVLFSGKPRALWVIDAGYYLVAFVIAAVILSVWP